MASKHIQMHKQIAFKYHIVSFKSVPHINLLCDFSFFFVIFGVFWKTAMNILQKFSFYKKKIKNVLNDLRVNNNVKF